MDLRPFRAWRYHTQRAGPLDTLTAPLTEFDAVASLLYRNYAHSIHLAAPRSTAQAADRWHRWRHQGMVRQDALPSLYAYAQTFQRGGGGKLTRTGVLGLVRLNDPAEARADTRYHEAVRPANVQALAAVLARTRCHPSPAFGLYHDPARQLEPLLEQLLDAPSATFTSADGVQHRLAPLQHLPTLQAVRETLAPLPLTLADGHHRTAAAELVRDRLAATGIPLPSDAPARYGFFYLSNSAAPPGQPNPNAIQPLHRVLQLAPDTDVEALLPRLERWFDVQPLDRTQLAQALPEQPYHYLLLARGLQRRLQLKPAFQQSPLPLDLHPAVQALDTTRLQHYALDRALDIPFAQHAADPRISYHKSLPAAAEAASHPGALGFLLRGVPLPDFDAAIRAGARMPAKTTYFEPKVLSGLLFASLDDDARQSPFDPGLWLPRRRQLLAEAGYAFAVHPANVDETPPPGASPAHVPRLLAERKALALASRYPDHLVLAADTVVDLDGRLLNKPADEAEACAMLTRLQGRAHQVHTGVCLLWTAGGEAASTQSFTDTSAVHMLPASPEAIAFYVQHHRPLDKAGAYGVQDWWGLRHVHRIEGCFYNVMGLPVPRLSQLLAELGF